MYLHKPRDQLFPKHPSPFKDVQENSKTSCLGCHPIFLLFWDEQFVEWRENVFEALGQARPATESPGEHVGAGIGEGGRLLRALGSLGEA